MNIAKGTILIAMLFSASFVPVCAGQQSGSEAKGLRVVHFPKRRSIGRLFVVDKGLAADALWPQWPDRTPLCKARGDVRVPKDRMLGLNAWKAGRALSALKSDDIQFLLLADADDSVMEDVGRLTGLVGLCLWGNDVIQGPGLMHLAGLGKLRFLWLPGHIRSRDLAYLSKLPSLECLYFAGPMVTDAKMVQVAKITSLKRLGLGGSEVGAKGLARLTELKSLQYLGLGGNRSDDLDDGLAPLSALAELEELDLQNTLVSDAGLAHLKQMTRLKKLQLKSNPPTLRITDAGMVYLKNLKSLEELELPYAGITDVGLAHLAELNSLRKINACGPGVTDKGVATLARMKSLQDLKVMSKAVTDKGMASLGECTCLRSLELNNCSISNAGLAHIKKLKSLTKLNITKTKVDGEGLSVLKELPLLTDLTLGFMNLGETGIAHLEGVASLEKLWLAYPDINIGDNELVILSGLTRLKYLDIRGENTTEPFTDKGFSHLSKLADLEFLQLDDGRMITNDGLKHLSNLTALEHIQMHRCEKITNAGLRNLEGLTSLKYLYLGDSRVTEAGLARLKKKIPGLMAMAPPKNPKQRAPSRR